MATAIDLNGLNLGTSDTDHNGIVAKTEFDAVTSSSRVRTSFDAYRDSKTEIAFIDRTVSSPGALLAGLRCNVEAVLLDASTPASTQIARALSDRTDIRAIHIVAHGNPGEVSFGAGPLTLANLDASASDLAAIGRALGADGELRLWSCRTGAGEHGAAFVEALADAAGAKVAAATGLVGAAALGGRWELARRSGSGAFPAVAPLSDHGIASYLGVMG
jgi:hypothetical protein